MGLRLIATLLVLVCWSCVNTSQRNAESTKSPTDWAMLGFVKADSINPILIPTSGLAFKDPIRAEEVKWEERNVLNPTAVVKDGKVFMIYRAQDQHMTSRLGLAISEDGLHFVKQPDPIFHPAKDKYGNL